MQNIGIVTDSKLFWQGIEAAAEFRNLGASRFTIDQLLTQMPDNVPSILVVDHIENDTEDTLDEFAIDFPETLMIIIGDTINSSFLSSFAYLVIPRTINFGFLMDIVGNAVTYQNLLLRNGPVKSAVKTEKRQETLDYKHHKNLLIARNGELLVQKEHLKLEKERLQGGLDELIESLLTIISYSNPKLSMHMRYVALLCEHLASSLNLSATETRNLRRAALLHDIGKTESQGKSETRHPVVGENLLAHIGGLCQISNIIRHHHERFDGKGYPDKLSRRDIPQASMIISVSNHVALLSNNGENIDLKEIVTSLSKKSSKEFDPILVKAMINELSRNTTVIQDNKVLISPSNLEPGMKTSDDVYTSHGLFLIPSGTLLDETTIDRIKRFHNIAPVPGGVEVFKDHMKENAQ